MKEDVYTDGSLEAGRMVWHRGPHWDALGGAVAGGGQEAEAVRDEGREPSWWFLQEKQGKAG